MEGKASSQQERDTYLNQLRCVLQSLVAVLSPPPLPRKPTPTLSPFTAQLFPSLQSALILSSIPQPPGEGLEGWVLEQLDETRSVLKTGGEAGVEPYQVEGVAAELEEVVCDADLLDSEDLAPEVGEGAFQLAAGGLAGGGGCDLAVALLSGEVAR